MMDSQENVLNEEAQSEVQNVNNPVANPEPEAGKAETAAQVSEELETVEERPEMVAEEAAEGVGNAETASEESEMPVEDFAAKVYKSKKEIVERLQELAHNDGTPSKDEVEHLKSVFYKIHVAEREAQLKAYIDGGGDPETYQIVPDEDEEAFKAEMIVIKEKRSKAFQEQEEEKQENLKRKLEIIEQVKAMATSPEEANKNFQEFKKLQQEWKDIKQVPADKVNELWRSYHLYVEQYYDLLKLNSEAREYDFKKNLEIKTRICEAAEKLTEEADVISAFHQLQKLHNDFRETGPVAKELREEIWARLKAASAIINKRHQQHFEELRAREEDNLVRKTALCEKAEAIAKEENKGSSDWDRHTKEMIALQAEWKTIGFAPQKMNVKIFERFRKTCDDFFGRKTEFFKEMKSRFAENAEKKKALVEQAQALQDSTDWKSTSDKLIALQKEWKTIGAVPKKQGDQLWNDFLGACNKFFEARNQANAGTRSVEKQNLEKKRGIIEQLKAMLEETGDNLQAKVQQLIEEYQSIGHVPFREKDKLYKEYHEVLDKLYKELNLSSAMRRLDNFKSNIKNMVEQGADVLDSERSKLMRRYEGLKQEIQTYENNLGFLNAASKKGSSLIDEMNRKVQKLKDEYELIRQKIKAIDAENKEN